MNTDCCMPPCIVAICYPAVANSPGAVLQAFTVDQRRRLLGIRDTKGKGFASLLYLTVLPITFPPINWAHQCLLYLVSGHENQMIQFM